MYIPFSLFLLLSVSAFFIIYIVCVLIFNFYSTTKQFALVFLQIVGAFWYLLAVERQDTCWQKACSDPTTSNCDKNYLYCGNEHMNGYAAWSNISGDVLKNHCEAEENGPFDYGIYENALSSGIASSKKFISKYCYCLWWGLQNLR